MADAVVKTHQADPETKDAWWQTIKVGLFHEWHKRLVICLEHDMLSNHKGGKLLTGPDQASASFSICE